jgi:hypothetical protein
MLQGIHLFSSFSFLTTFFLFYRYLAFNSNRWANGGKEEVPAVDVMLTVFIR